MKRLLLLSTLAGFALYSSAQDVQIKKVPAPHTKASSGSQMFREYCAACHGLTGVGDGPAGPALKGAPADLTSLKAANHGNFPEARIGAVLRGSVDFHAHGSADMPTWGPLFHSMDGGNDSALMELRVHNLTEYLKSIQK